MSKTLAVINIILVITDLILSALVVAGFAWAAWHFDKWWLVLFMLIPAGLYSNHSMIIDADIRENEIDKLHPHKGGGEDTKG